MVFLFHLKIICKFISRYYKNDVFVFSGMETKIRSQHETIVELEDKIKSCTEEIIKVRLKFHSLLT